MTWSSAFSLCCSLFSSNRRAHAWEDPSTSGLESVVDCRGGLVVCIRAWGHRIVWWIVSGSYSALPCPESKLVRWHWRPSLVDVIANIVVLYSIFKLCSIMKSLISWCTSFTTFATLLLLIIVLYNPHIIKIFWQFQSQNCMVSGIFLIQGCVFCLRIFFWSQSKGSKKDWFKSEALDMERGLWSVPQSSENGLSEILLQGR